MAINLYPACALSWARRRLLSGLAPDAPAAQLCVRDSYRPAVHLTRSLCPDRGGKIRCHRLSRQNRHKDMLCRMLAGFGRTHATKGNYNNHIGAPLTLAQMPEDTEFLACELGMNHAGELSELAQIVKPSVTAITCIADSHIGHFSSLEQIADAKAELFTGLADGGLAILPRDDVFYPRLAAAATQPGQRKSSALAPILKAVFVFLTARETITGLW